MSLSNVHDMDRVGARIGHVVPRQGLMMTSPQIFNWIERRKDVVMENTNGNYITD